MQKKFVFFSLLFVFGLLIFLIYPQISFAVSPSVVNLGPSVGKTSFTLNASATAATGDTLTKVGFGLGTASGNYTCTTTETIIAAATAIFAHPTSTSFCGTNIDQGTVYYFRAYASTTPGTGYATNTPFLTGINDPGSLARTARSGSSIDLSWTKGTGANNTYLLYRTDQYPTAIDDIYSAQGCITSGTSCSVDRLDCGKTYYFRAWSSTTATGLSTTSASYVQLTESTGGCLSGKVCVGPNVFADSLVINQGAAKTQTREVQLSLKVDSATLMSICNDSRFLGCGLESYSTTKSHTLTEGDGEKTVYAVFTSDCGMNSDYVSDTITLKTPVPAPIVPIPVEEVVEEVPTEEVAEEAPVEEEVAEEVVEEVTVESLKAKITEIQQKIIELLKQLIQLIQQQIAELTS